LDESSRPTAYVRQPGRRIVKRLSTNPAQGTPMSLAHGYAVHSTTAPLVPFSFERRVVGANDIRIEILYSGICHSDLHQARDDWGGSQYPMVPGHEIIGRVVEVGADVTRLKVGDFAGVGC